MKKEEEEKKRVKGGEMPVGGGVFEAGGEGYKGHTQQHLPETKKQTARSNQGGTPSPAATMEGGRADLLVEPECRVPVGLPPHLLEFDRVVMEVALCAKRENLRWDGQQSST